MRPRSIVFTLYGDYLRYTGEGEAPLGALSDLLALFGVERATTRMVMSRLRAEGWFETRREGRRTSYLLSPRARRLLDEGRDRIFRHDPAHWDGSWTLVLTRAGDRTARDEFRSAMSWVGFGSLQPATWLAPGDRRSAAHELLDDRPDVDADVFLSRTDDLAADGALAARCWDLDGLGREYERFLRDHDLPDPADDDTALEQRIRLTDDYRRFPFRDPDLPRLLLPAAWPGYRAQALFARRHESLRGRAESAIERIVGIPVIGAHRVRVDETGISSLADPG